MVAMQKNYNVLEWCFQTRCGHYLTCLLTFGILFSGFYSTSGLAAIDHHGTNEISFQVVCLPQYQQYSNPTAALVQEINKRGAQLRRYDVVQVTAQYDLNNGLGYDGYLLCVTVKYNVQ